MNKEILFRGKDKNGIWIIGLPSYSEDGEISDIEVYGDGTSEFIGVKSDTVCQYTGLEDKNGVKIFTNDIIIFTANNRNIYKNKPYRVHWNPTACVYEIGENFFGDNAYIPRAYINLSKSKKCKVIGNIYDNPELLKV